MQSPIVDLHCDLLSFLADDPKRTVLDPASNASYPQMKEGRVALQTLAIFTKSQKGSLSQGKAQITALENLLSSSFYELWNPNASLEEKKEKIFVLPAFENAYGFLEEDEKLDVGFKRVEDLLKKFKRILYISLTWDGENRFGGGCGSKCGLKDEGKKLLDWLDGKKIAIDFSHASDFLADDLFNYLDKKSLKIPVIASHSNMRAITPKERNLPDFLAQEIIRRKGVIGLNLFTPFIGNSAKEIAFHVEHLFSLGGENTLCFGADFFPELDFSYLQKKYQISSCFFPELNNASCYPKALEILKANLSLTSHEIQNISHNNFKTYLTANF